MRKIVVACVAVIGCGIMTGCAGNRLSKAKYIAEGEPITGTAEQATVYDLDSGAQALLDKLRKHPTFLRGYEKMKEKTKVAPSLVIDAFKCNFKVTPSEQARLDMAQTKISVSMFESDMFVLRDAPLARELGMTAPDCQLQCFFNRVEEKGGCFVYRLHIRLTDLCAASILWEGAETVQKVD